MATATIFAVCVWPDAPFTRSLVENALEIHQIREISLEEAGKRLLEGHRVVFWSTYDAIDHELVHKYPEHTLSSSYVIRKALIRKHFLAQIVHMRNIKHPETILRKHVPSTYQLEISFADELDELLADDLYELAKKLEETHSWWILKPGMADRGQGLRMFNSRRSLESIFQEFEDEDSDEEEERNSTNVMTSQLRHFVIQSYIPDPLLLNPHDPSSVDYSLGRKFHLRAYVVASGALSLYLLKHVLSLFSAVPYKKPEESDDFDLTPHLTNTSLQTDRGDENVFLLDELVKNPILSAESQDTFTNDHALLIRTQMMDILEEIFKSALEFPVHYQPLDNAFELYGVDFIVSHKPSGPSVQLLEINAEPAIELTGPRLTWILKDLFNAIGAIHLPAFSRHGGRPSVFQDESWRPREEKHNLLKICDIAIRGGQGPCN